jgi:flagellar biosynthetic protein FliQ
LTPEFIIRLGQETLLLALQVAGPALLVALVVGLAVSIFQAVTQIHEMTLTFIPKILSVAAVMMLLLPWVIKRIVGFTVQLISSIPTIVG